MKKTSAIVCAVLAGTFGLGSVASAQGMGRGWDHGDRNDRNDRGDRAEQHQDRHDDRREGWRDGRRDDRRGDGGWRAGYQQPHYGYQQPGYRHAQRFYRGGYLPYEYRHSGYYVNNWRAYPSLYAPAYGQQWVNVDGEFLLVALATGLIANAVLN